MSETRTKEKVSQEYTLVCANIGHVSYQIFTMNKDLEILHQQARDLNLEVTKLAAEPSAEVKTNE